MSGELVVNPEDLDPRMIDLVTALNEITDVFTYSSCGGHEPKQHQYQNDGGTFHVSMDIEHTQDGWAALDLIARAIDECFIDECQLSAWYDGGIRWSLQGWRWADPDMLAAAIRRLLNPTASD